MGDQRADQAVAAARSAWELGRPIFFALLHHPRPLFGTADVWTWSDAVRDIEAVGWALRRWQVTDGEREMLLVGEFRRA